MLRQKLDYIDYNPVKRGYVDEPVHWRYSSARTLRGLMPVVWIGSTMGVVWRGAPLLHSHAAHQCGNKTTLERTNEIVYIISYF
jgi:hypothetical protein